MSKIISMLATLLLAGCASAPPIENANNRAPSAVDESFESRWDRGTYRVKQCLFGGMMAVFAIPVQGLAGFSQPICGDHVDLK